MAEGTIRAQAKKAKVEAQNGRGVKPVQDGREKMDKEIVKAVLASPLIIPWPNIPNHLQKSVLAALPKLATPELAEYHVSRARCHQQVKKHNKKLLKRKIETEGSTEVTKPSETDLISVEGKVGTPVEIQKPDSPAVLNHLVLGINETIKQLERNIDDLKLRLSMIADALNATHASHIPTSGLLPTAPRSPSPESTDSASLGWVVVPLMSISPQSLVSPIPQYCATYNAHVYQWEQLRNVVKARLKESQWGVLGAEREEIRVIPLGDVEMQMASIVGLRRLACMGIKTSHPQIKILHDLLPKSILHPPRYKITLPFPSSTLKVHSNKESDKTTKTSAKKPRPALPKAGVHYAPLMVKGVTTTVPSDGNAKKHKRLIEVRQKRLETKEKKKQKRKEEFLKGIKGEKGKVPRHGAKKVDKGSKRATKKK